MSRDTETGAAQRSSIVGHLVRSLFSTWTPRDANFYTNRDTTGDTLMAYKGGQVLPHARREGLLFQAIDDEVIVCEPSGTRPTA